jgi:hypothetical protein
LSSPHATIIEPPASARTAAADTIHDSFNFRM